MTTCRDRAHGLLVIVPAYNEAGSVGRVVDEIHRCLPDADVLVVDDGSADESGDIAQTHGAMVLRLPYNLGVGGAMRAGYKYAVRMRYAVAVQVDADGQHDPAEVPALLAALGDADVVIGARFAGKGDYVVRGPRRWAMTALARSVSRQSGRTLTDVTSGFRACNVRAIELFGCHYPAEYLGDTVESLLIARRAGLRLEQVPVRMRVRDSGTASQTPLSASLYLGRAVLAMLLTGMRSAHDEVTIPRLASIESGALHA